MEEEKIELTRSERLRLFWEAPEFEGARRFAGDPEEYSYDDITDKDLDQARVPKYQGEPLPLPVKEQSGREYLLSTLGMGGDAVDVDDRPVQETSNYLQVVETPKPGRSLLDAHWNVMHNMRESIWQLQTDPYCYMEECLAVANVFAVADPDEEPVELFLRLPQPHQASHDLRNGILGLMMQLSDRGWSAEIFSDFRIPTAENSKYQLKLSIRVTPDGPVKPKYWGGAFDMSKYNFTGHEKLSAYNVTTLEAYEGFWLLMDRFEAKLDDVDAAHQLVGDLSEGALLCSYNEDDIRQLWINGHLNERIKSLAESMPWEYERFLRQMRDKVREDGDYEAALTEVIAKVNGWPKHWSSDPNDLEQLTIQEQLKVLPLQLEMVNSRQQALNRYCDLRAELEKRLPSNATGTNQ